MSGEYPGGDTVYVVTDVATGQKDGLNQPKFGESVAEVFGCVFDVVSTGPTEEQSDTTTNSERAWVFLPIVDGQGIPTVDFDQDGELVYIAEIPNTARLRPERGTALGQRDYKIIGRPEVQYDLDGQPDHVWIVCEWRGGGKPTDGG
ncbi:hypothetical protein [Mycolicibacter heraklionensis]|uniref:hypothetical protein n=1 Tax=Mycolicibacter heraklionensis TaxID=512402 RepID=UPI000641EA52|nr:hypothetical protein [Mycolicibacter heraklionensis]